MASFNGTLSAVVAQSVIEVEATDKAFVSIYDASKAVGCSISWLRLAEQRGTISSYRTPGNHRRYSIAKLKSELYGLDYEQLADDARKVAIYSRCSSVSQKDAELTQRKDLLEKTAERENVPESEIVVYSEIASSFKERPVLMRMINDIVANKLRCIVFSYKDRLSRTDSFYIVKSLAEQHNVKLVFLYTEPPKTDIEEMTQELVNFVTLIGNRQAAAKSSKVCTKHIPVETLNYCFEQLDAGVSYTDLCEKLRVKGMTYDNGDEIKMSCLRNKITKLRKAGFNKAEIDATTFDKWYAARTAKSATPTLSATLYRSYEAYCCERQLPAKPHRFLQNWLDSKGIKKQGIKTIVGKKSNGKGGTFNRYANRAAFLLGIKG